MLAAKITLGVFIWLALGVAGSVWGARIMQRDFPGWHNPRFLRRMAIAGPLNLLAVGLLFRTFAARASRADRG